MLTVGLTGGVGSGKSTVAKLFAELGIEVIDADSIAREVVTKGENALHKITQYFGNDILLENGELDRKKLGKKIFADETARKWLENLLHPVIRSRINTKIQHVQSTYCIIVIPLLVETHVDYVDRVLVVDCDETLQLERIVIRDNITNAQAKNMLKAQTSRKARCSRADDVILNENDIKSLRCQVKRLHERYHNHID